MDVDNDFVSSHINEMRSIKFWKSISPDLTITDHPFRRKPAILNISAESADFCANKIKEDGYFKLESVLPKAVIRRMEKAVINLVNKGIPPVFIYLYDEPWQAFKNISPIMDKILGPNYRLSMSTWAWHIPPTSDNAGFSPHRDEIKIQSMRQNGMPMMATAWIPLSDVTTDHSCMHLLPTSKDVNVPDNLSDITIPPSSFRDIQALPCNRGSVLSWNSHVLHWGSRSSSIVNTPRTSIAAFLKSADEKNIKSISLESSQRLPLEFRLGAIGEVMTIYNNGSFDDTSYPHKLLQLCTPYTQKFLLPPNRQRIVNENDVFIYEFKRNLMPRTEPTEMKVGRNDPCHCGSGQKYKKCHGN